MYHLNLSKVTLEFLKCCNKIKDSIIIHKGSYLLTEHFTDNLVFVAQIPDEFPCQFKINKLSQLLSGIDEISNHGKNNIEIMIDDPYIIISDPTSKEKMQFVLGTLSPTEQEPPEIDRMLASIEHNIEFELSNDLRSSLFKKASILGNELIEVKDCADGLHISSVPKIYYDNLQRSKGNMGMAHNSFDMILNDYKTKNKEESINKSYFLKAPFSTLPPGLDYVVGIAEYESKRVCRFTHTTEDNRIVRLFISLEGGF